MFWSRPFARRTTTSIATATPDKAIAALKGYGGTVIKASLSEEDTQKLQEALTPQEPVGAS